MVLLSPSLENYCFTQKSCGRAYRLSVYLLLLQKEHIHVMVHKIMKYCTSYIINYLLVIAINLQPTCYFEDIE